MRLAGVCLTAVLVMVSGCGRENQATTAKEPPVPRQTPAVSRAVALYFERSDMTLAAEQRVLTIPSNEAEAIETLVEALLEGPRSPQLAAVFPAGITLRAAFSLPQKTAVIDLAGEPLSRGWNGGAHGEWMAMQAVAHTLARNLQVQQVRFLVNGHSAPTLGGHVAIAWGIRPTPVVLAPSAASSAPSPDAAQPVAIR